MIAPLKDRQLQNLLPAYSFAIYWNVLGMPSGVVIQGLVNSDETSFKDGSGDSYEYHANQAMKDSAGLPVGI